MNAIEKMIKEGKFTYFVLYHIVSDYSSLRPNEFGLYDNGEGDFNAWVVALTKDYEDTKND